MAMPQSALLSHSKAQVPLAVQIFGAGQSALE